MKIIFLDIDGVLLRLPRRDIKAYRGLKGDKKRGDMMTQLTDSCIHNFKKIIDETDAYIVISSSWRRSPYLMEQIEDQFKQYQDGPERTLWDRVIGKTPCDLNFGRGFEIHTWIDNYHTHCEDGLHINNWIVIDDDDFDMKYIKAMGKFIKTLPHQGLDNRKARNAISLLNS